MIFRKIESSPLINKSNVFFREIKLCLYTNFTTLVSLLSHASVVEM